MKYLKQKSLLLLLLFCFVVISTQIVANPISRSQAQRNVQDFLQERDKSINLSSLRHVPIRATQNEESQPYYIFNIGNNQGYIIASGDDCAFAVLGYADSGSIDVNNIPCNMQWWLDEYARQIQFMQQHAFSVKRSPKKFPIGPNIPAMLTCQWSQYEPYNQNCPVDTNGNRCLTGCVATAMAQVMYYHRANSVKQTTREIPGYVTTRGVTVETIPAGSLIDWDNMRDYYWGNATEVQNDAVANLMKYCGTAVETYYTSQSSGSSTSDIELALLKYFNYSSRIKIIDRDDNITDEEWENLIYSELSASRPVIYSGRSSSSGHAFICDGYDGNGFFHFNWGWGGYLDGFYLVTACDVEGELIEYNFSQYAITHIEPRTSLPVTSDYIHFVDINAELLSLKMGDANDDGVLTIEEAAAVTELGHYYKVTSFDEFKYFTGVTAIDDRNFSSCRNYLTNITLPKSLKIIGICSFDYCDKLESIVIPDSVVSIGLFAFDHCSGLTNLTIGKSLKDVNHYAFNCCDNVKSLTWNARNCTSFSLWDPIEQLIIGDEVEVIPDYFVRFSAIKSVNIPNSVKVIGEAAFMNCGNLIDVTIGNSVKTISVNSFRDCENLTSISLGSSVNTIGNGAFYECYKVSSVTCNAHIPPKAYYYSFGDEIYSNATLNVPIDDVNAYESKYPWWCFKQIVGFGPYRADVNLDGEINIADVNALIHQIIDTDFTDRGDVNLDGEVTVADINAVIDKILSDK